MSERAKEELLALTQTLQPLQEESPKTLVILGPKRPTAKAQIFGWPFTVRLKIVPDTKQKTQNPERLRTTIFPAWGTRGLEFVERGRDRTRNNAWEAATSTIELLPPAATRLF